MFESERVPYLIAFTFFSFFPGIYTCYFSLPIKDYLPYRVGASIKRLMEVPPFAPKPVYEISLYYKNKNTGEIRVFNSSNAPWQDTANWVYVKTETKLIEEGYIPPIQDFSAVSIDGTDITEELLSGGYQLWVVAYDLHKSSKKGLTNIAPISYFFDKYGIKTYLLTASDRDFVNKWVKENSLPWTITIMDGTTLKSMIRSNPGLLLVWNGTILGKWHYNSLPSVDEIMKKVLK